MRFLTAGESHGKVLTGIIEGIPAGLSIDSSYINEQLLRRQKGHGRGGRMNIENDQVKILSGVRNGKTMGSPISLMIENLDWKNWKDIMSVEVSNKSKKVTLPRPGHADLAGVNKYDFDDIRDVIERSSARETTMRVALSCICRKLLEDLGISLCSHVTAIKNICSSFKFDGVKNLKNLNSKADYSPIRCLDQNVEQNMINAIDTAKMNGDSVGGQFEIIVMGLPYGLGSYVHWDRKLHAQISSMLMSINAMKSIEFGNIDIIQNKTGSNVHDQMYNEGGKVKRYTNNSGGLEGGMTNSQPLTLRMTMKPLSSLAKPLESVDIESKEQKKAHKERSDSCAVPAASIIAENTISFVLVDAILDKFGGDSMKQLKGHYKLTAKF
ncbi:MAG: chorismate synthase [Pelagibacteraceae bacterium TMED237]|nr:chorismate synthase [Candidatus Neomarinimicrobiota bacterium]OUW96323.1 MAG: chorismate synthase [Pelagibacteraceae bacterium TMED237]